MTRGSIRVVMTLTTLGLMAGAWGPHVNAQELPGANDYHLPSATPAPTPSPAAVGPVDRGVPPPKPISTAPATAAPTPAAPTATPVIVIPSPAPSTRAPRPAPIAAPRISGPVTSPAATNNATPSLGTNDTAATPPVVNQPTPLATSPVTAVPPPTKATNAAGSRGWLLPIALAALILALAGAGLLWARRQRNRGHTLSAPDFVRPTVPETTPEAAQETPAVSIVPPVAAPAQILALALDTTRMSATLVNATLAYRLSVTNTGSAAIEDVTIGGDMISAHASLPVEQQLGLSGEVLPVLHRVARIEPGQSIALGGDIRLPLTAILPIRSGNAALFVPLARIEVRGQCDGQTVETRTAYLVGQQPDTPSTRLQPFRLDLGPRVYAQIGQRPIRMQE